MDTTRPTKAIIVAAGRGRRLMPYTDQMPKCLVPIAGRSILEWQLRAFAAHGVREVVIVRGYLGHVLEQRLAGLGLDARLIDNPEFETNNILHSLFYAAGELDGPVFVTYSDIVFTPAVVRALIESHGEVCLAIDRDFARVYEGRTEHPLSEAEVADLDDAGNVRRVGKRALPPEHAWGEFIGLVKLSAGASALFGRTWNALRTRVKDHEPFQRAERFRNAYLTDLLQHLIDAGHPVTPVGIRGGWREIDTVQDLTRAESLLGSTAEDWT